ncbi:MAG: 2-oxoacid:acceptor oxidoreductase subunit alpha [Candidatus Coatesbacteria bacterium]|nr:MAG: 2-oxoacid:acceptor oxidoreductase subunit alpha [Candidatus Coatesbacteria bacterium]
MKADSEGVRTGIHYLDGDRAAAEGAIAAGCRFFAGYPITPSTESAEHISERFPQVGGIFIQMEDEIGSITAVIGAAWGGARSMTVTSGPGISLMMENIGLAAMLETPCVIANVQRGGPSTGLPTMVGQADVMQARWGSHGDYEIIAYAPESPQEAFDLTVKAFNMSERYRTPVIVLLDECVGHMVEKVTIPEADEIEIEPRRLTKAPIGEYLPYAYGEDLVPDMALAGMGYRFHVTGLTHDERGYPDMSEACQEWLVPRLLEKIRANADDIIQFVEEDTEGADVVVLSYGISARVSRLAIQMAREKGLKVGFLRLQAVWPFPEKRIAELAKQIRSFVVVEINLGQIFYEVQRCAAGQCETLLSPHAGGGVHRPENILKVIEKGAKAK